jgi:hypothetical protein
MAAIPMSVSMGIRTQFPSVKRYLKSYILALKDHDETVAQLTAYGAGIPVIINETYTKTVRTYGVIDSISGLTRAGVHEYWHAIHGALSGSVGWAVHWRRAVAYDYWAALVDYAWHLHSLDEFGRGKRPQQLRMLSLRSLGFCLGNCLSLGWLDYAKNLAQTVDESLKRGFVSDVTDPVCRFRIQYFLLRLGHAWQHLPVSNSDVYPRDEPIYEALLENWSDSDVTRLTPWLLAACDRHTQEARTDNNKQFFELANTDTWYVPFEILSVLRLREQLGLPAASIEHPLMNTALGGLLPVTKPFTDELLESVLRRLAQQLPQFRIA